MNEELTQLKFLGLYNLATKTYVISVIASNYHKEKFEFEGESYAEIHSSKPVKYQESTKNDKGQWVIKILEKDYAIIACSGKDYKKRIIHKLFEEIEDHFDEEPQWEDRDQKVIKKKFKGFLKANFKKYLRPENVDKLSKAILKAKQLQHLAEQDLKQVIKNNQDINNLDEQTNDFLVMAQGFEQNTKTVEKQMRCENIRWMIYTGIGVVALGALLYFKFF